jgi:hypothetical protein
MSRRTILHVAQDAIRRQDGSPAIILRDHRGATRHHEVELVRDGEVLGKFVYSPDKPLSCGARVWLETYSDKLELRPCP